MWGKKKAQREERWIQIAQETLRVQAVIGNAFVALAAAAQRVAAAQEKAAASTEESARRAEQASAQAREKLDPVMKVLTAAVENAFSAKPHKDPTPELAHGPQTSH